MPSRHRYFAPTELLLAVAFCTAPVHAAAPQSPTLRLDGLRTEYQTTPIGIDVRVPRLSWKIHASRRGTMQRAYEIRVATDSVSLGRPRWSSGKVASDASTFVEYG